MAAMHSSLRAIAVPIAVVAALVFAGCGGSDDDSKTTGTTAQASSGPALGPAFHSIAALPGALKSPPPTALTRSHPRSCTIARCATRCATSTSRSSFT